jgi:hypothetical protein
MAVRLATSDRQQRTSSRKDSKNLAGVDVVKVGGIREPQLRNCSVKLFSSRLTSNHAKWTKQEFLIRFAFDEALKGNILKKLSLLKLLEIWAPQSIDPPPPIVIESISGDETL